MQDLSFIRLEPNFQDAKNTGQSNMASIFFNGQICLSPNETYLQTTNTKLGIAFDGNYQVTIINCDGLQLQDITSKVAINERTINGLPQIDFEIVNINSDYYAKTVFLKFRHTVSNYVWYSNPLNITNYFINESSRFDYKNATDTYYQSIRLKTYFTVPDAESQSSEYVTYEGKKLTSRLITTDLEKYIFDKIDNFTYRRLNNLLSRNVIYINGNRVTDKQTIPSKDRIADSNIFNIDFKVAIDYNENYLSELQIFGVFDLINKQPFGSYTLASLPSVFTGTFNRLFTKEIGTIKLYKDNTLLNTYNLANITVSGVNFTLPLTGVVVANGSYYLNIDNGLFKSSLGEVYQGISNTTDWAFVVSSGEYSNTDYNNEYLIN
jgi:hypothetical protein